MSTPHRSPILRHGSFSPSTARRDVAETVADDAGPEAITALRAEVAALRTTLARRERELAAIVEKRPPADGDDDLSLAVVVETVPGGVVVLAVDGTVVCCNLTARRLLGRVGHTCKGRRLVSVGPVEVAALPDRTPVEIAAAEDAEDFEQESPAGPGPPEGSAAVRVRAIRLPGLPRVARVLTLTDLTTEQEQAAATDRLVAMLAHEIRNPLSAIAASAAIVDRADAPALLTTAARRVIGQQSDHLRRIVDDLLDVTAVRQGQVRLQRRPLDLTEIVAEVIETVTLTRSQIVRPLVEAAAEPVTVAADPVRIVQVLTSLIDNAIDHGGGDQPVRITCHTDGDAAVLTVRDGGVGLTDTQMRSMFTPFVQGDQGLARTRGGLGVGLSVARTIIERHGGTIGVASDGPGTGTTFTVRLPRVDVPATAKPTAAPERRGKSLLLVDDNADALTMLAAMLRLEGHHVEIAADGDAGLERWRAVRPEVAVLDIGLPGRDGYSLARAITAEAGTDRPLLIALSGYTQPEDRRRSREAGFDDHLAKPVDLRKLIGRIAQGRTFVSRRDAGESSPRHHPLMTSTCAGS